MIISDVLLKVAYFDLCFKFILWYFKLVWPENKKVLQIIYLALEI
jgi:hypothetical protein